MDGGGEEDGGVMGWWERQDLNLRCILRGGFTDRCLRQLGALSHVLVALLGFEPRLYRF